MRTRFPMPMLTTLSALAATLALALVAAPAGAADKLKAGSFEPARVAPDVALTATDGAPFKLAKYRGKVVVLEFGVAGGARAGAQEARRGR
jgi:cytochrome oxidase Cu insertion factor (SCO1/SenC/PrrC family)